MGDSCRRCFSGLLKPLPPTRRAQRAQRSLLYPRESGRTRLVNRLCPKCEATRVGTFAEPHFYGGGVEADGTAKLDVGNELLADPVAQGPGVDLKDTSQLVIGQEFVKAGRFHLFRFLWVSRQFTGGFDSSTKPRPFPQDSRALPPEAGGPRRGPVLRGAKCPRQSLDRQDKMPRRTSPRKPIFRSSPKSK